MPGHPGTGRSSNGHSLDALRGIDADLLLPGHGDPRTRGTAVAVNGPGRPAPRNVREHLTVALAAGTDHEAAMVAVKSYAAGASSWPRTGGGCPFRARGDK